MSDGIEPLSRVGLESIAPAAPSTRVRRDDQGKREQPRDQPEPDDDEDDGHVHVDVRA